VPSASAVLSLPTIPGQDQIFPVASLVSTNIVETQLERRFHALVEEWRNERGPTSSITEMVACPSYRAIIALGKPAIPLILAEMIHRPDYWFAALRELTGANPVRPGHRGDLDAMTRDWILWGLQTHLITTV